MPAKITREVIEAHLHCRYKGHLRLAGARAEPPAYQALKLRDRLRVRDRAAAAIRAGHGPDEVGSDLELSAAALKRGWAHLLDVRVEGDGVSLALDGLRRVPGRSALGDFHYAPVLYHEAGRVGPRQRLLAAVLARAVGDLRGRPPVAAFVYRAGGDRPARVGLTARVQEEAGRAWRDLGEQQAAGVPPRLVLNAHCAECEFRDGGRREAVAADDLSLIQGLGEKDVRRFARKGIPTVTQLAHTFRPRRQRRRSRDGRPGRNPALQALAIRDGRTYVFGTPQLPDAPVRVYLDLEGKPDERFVYLVGVLLVDGAAETRRGRTPPRRSRPRRTRCTRPPSIARSRRPSRGPAGAPRCRGRARSGSSGRHRRGSPARRRPCRLGCRGAYRPGRAVATTRSGPCGLRGLAVSRGRAGRGRPRPGSRATRTTGRAPSPR